MSYLDTKNINKMHKSSGITQLTEEDKDNFDILMFKSVFAHDSDINNDDDLKYLNKYILDISNNIEKYIKLPLKELLLLTNLIELNDDASNILELVSELRSYIKITLKNCNNLLAHRFGVIKKQIESTEEKSNVLQSTWNSKLFIDIAILIQKICKQQQISLTGEKVFLCITEIYSYFSRLSIDLDPRFVNWFLERFLYENKVTPHL